MMRCGAQRLKMDSEDAAKASRKISCCSKQAVSTAITTLLSSVNQHIDKTKYNEEFREGLKQRFKEIYENTVHDNITVDGQTWSQSLEDGNTTKDYEAVDLELKKEVSTRTLELDELMVKTTAKRRTHPTKVSHEVTKRMKHLRHAVEKYKPVIQPVQIKDKELPKQVLDEESKRLQEAGCSISAISRDLPLLEDKASRLIEARQLRSSMKSNRIYKIISQPLTDESKMAASLTPLQHRLANETPSPIKQTPRHSLRALKVQSHPINNNFKVEASDKST
ncbi:kinetochore-associated protein NSL1 homolog [Lytechinus variegatus]|uniref:kinetochore-associated protein NSL1 homolog n=1 Tax=Lytechinus variegatus TaxID=7654 RepID=UPI001BB157D5|nr:kinetochore-associated protein NSL1 homolog [Lytechinus variegatus]